MEPTQDAFLLKGRAYLMAACGVVLLAICVQHPLIWSQPRHTVATEQKHAQEHRELGNTSTAPRSEPVHERVIADIKSKRVNEHEGALSEAERVQAVKEVIADIKAKRLKKSRTNPGDLSEAERTRVAREVTKVNVEPHLFLTLTLTHRC